jgi:hypoxanthine phosphoribosyltransferase
MAEVLVPNELGGSAESSRGRLETKPVGSTAPNLGLDRPGTGKPLIDSTRIARRVRQLGRQISEVYSDIDTPLVLVVILKGATVFASDLLRSLSIPAELEFVRASSYPTGTTSNGRLRLAHMVDGPLVGRHVLLVEDIVDSGITVNAVARRIKRLGPASLRIAALLDRPARRAVEVTIDFCGFVIPDRFVIGYGLDYAGLYRELPHIYSLT